MRTSLAVLIDRHAPPLTVTQKILVVLGLTLAFSYLLTLSRFHSELTQVSQQQSKQLAELIGNQTALISAPLLIANDSVSLNVGLQQLMSVPQINGALIEDGRGGIHAQAGEREGARHEIPLLSGEERLGTLYLFIKPEPAEKLVADMFTTSSLAAMLGALVTLVAGWQLGRHLSTPLRDLATAQRELLEQGASRPLTTNRKDEWQTLNQQFNQLHAQQLAPLPDTEVDEVDDSELAFSADADDDDAELTFATDENEEDDGDLSFEAEPPVEPMLQQAPRSHSSSEDDPPSTALSEAAQPADSATQTSALQQQADTPEQPSSASTVRYLLLVDCQMGQGEQDSLRLQLLAHYRQQLQQVGQLYRGKFTEHDNGNWSLLFEEDSECEHDQLALCAAQLFNRLYRGFNQQRIKQFSPVLDLRMSLVQGWTDLEQLTRSAGRLCQQVESNELITEETLFTTPSLQTRLLADAQYQKAEGGLYLIHSLAPAYQDLLEQQAQHLLERLQAN